MEAAGKLFPHTGRAGLGSSSLLLMIVLPVGIPWAKGRLSLWFVGVFPCCWLMDSVSVSWERSRIETGWASALGLQVPPLMGRAG